ncbi:hypothetical protein M8818_006813 [Zalaria obscura]|uniref:Uncharacterized protein n=1 Tax=Zalaria obscura TaxID=2024903 RepID=A0ACC3S4Y5_9PEZI
MFFTSWKLWEKMTFVLTICAGCLKLWYTTRRTRKYTALQAIQAKSASIKRRLSRKSTAKSTIGDMRETRKRTDKRGNDVPFGIRAIESGIEVEGVWISRSNTPASSRDVSDSSLLAHLPRHHSAVDLSSLEAQTEPATSSTGGSRPTSMSMSQDLTFSTISDPSRPPSPEPTANPMRSRENTDETSPSSSSSTDSSHRSEGSNGDNDMAHHQYTFAHTPQPRANRRTDLELVEHHRLSHVAETGQLLPRIRQPGHSGEWASMARYSLPVTPSTCLSGPDDYFTPPTSAESNPFSTPKEPSVTQLVAEESAAENEQQALHEPQEPNRFSFTLARPQSQILRRVNSGFAILKPGTLDPPPDAPQRQRSRAATIDDAKGERQPRKLQKKRRASQDSTASSYGRSQSRSQSADRRRTSLVH